MSGVKIMRRVADDFLLWEVVKIMVPNKWCTRSNFWGLAKGSLTGVTIFGCSVRKLARNYLVGLKSLYPRQEAAVVKLVLRDHNSGQQQICRRLEAHCQAHKRQAEENCAGALNTNNYLSLGCFCCLFTSKRCSWRNVGIPLVRRTCFWREWCEEILSSGKEKSVMFCKEKLGGRL